MWPMWIGKITEEGAGGDKFNLFDILDTEPADAIEQSVAEKEKVCKLGYP